MKYTKLLLLTPLTALAIFAAACNGDDSVSAPGADGGSDGNPMNMMTDGSNPNPGMDGSMPGDGGGGDGGPCDFNTYVLGLVTNHTNGTDKPVTDLGDTCTDTHTLVPQTTF